MTKTEQTNTIKKALELTEFISESREKLNSYRSATYPGRPMPPSHQTLTVTYPEIKSSVKFWSPILWLTLCFTPFPFIYYFCMYKPKKEQDIEIIRNSEEYRCKCAEIDADVKRRQRIIDEEFERATKEYNEITIPTYEKEKAKWEADLKQKIAEAQSAIERAEKELEDLYATTRIVPLQYRSIGSLRYIYDTVSTSDYDINGAIELYDKYRQRRLDEERLYEQQVANSIADEQNELLNRQNDIANRARREANVANIVGAVQHHNTNKMLKNHFGKK